MKSKIIAIASILSKEEGLKRIDMIEKLEISKASIERYLKIAQITGIIQYIGSAKTGGYFLTEAMQIKIAEYQHNK